MGVSTVVTGALKLAVYHRNINLMTCILYVDINSGNPKVPLIIEILSYRESYKMTVVCLSVLSVFQFKIFLRNGWLVFFFISARWEIIGIFKNWLIISSRKIHIFQNSDKNFQNDTKTVFFACFFKTCH